MKEPGTRLTADVLAGRRGEALVRALEREGVELRRAGREFVALCPFHAERTASFHVNAETGLYFCFGCGAKGDALTFTQAVRGLSFPDALEDLAGELGASTSPAAPRRAARPASPPERNAGVTWAVLALHDDAAETYLAERGLLFRDREVLRFNVGSSGDSWLDARADEGYRVAFAARRFDGEVQTISLRYSLPGKPPDGKKTLCLPGCSTKGAAIYQPGLEQLALGDPEFQNDRILLLEGGTSWLGATALFSQVAADLGAPPTWALGAIGVGQVAGVVAAFAPVIRWRKVLVGLDADEAGEGAAPSALEAALAAGAREPERVVPPLNAKDWADLARLEYANG